MTERDRIATEEDITVAPEAPVTTEELVGLHPLSSLEDWEFAEGEPDVRGWSVLDDNDEKIGTVDDLIVDAETGEIIFAVIAHGGLLGLGQEETAIPLDLLDVDEDDGVLKFLGVADEVREAPRYSSKNADYDQYYDFWSDEGVELPPTEA